MPLIQANGIDIFYESHGDPDDVPLLLINGLGSQLINWDDDFCAALVDRGFHVVRFDNRDVGLSQKFDGAHGNFMDALTKAAQGEPVDVPYRLTDMAADAVGLLTALGIDAAHIVGASMGGMIAQTVAIEHPDRVLSLTSIMSTTGEAGFGLPTAEAGARLLIRPPLDREASIEHSTETQKIIGSPEHFDEDRTRARVAAAYDRCFDPSGVGRQMLGVLASGPRAEGLAALDVPTLVLHGDVDTLVGTSGGTRTAELIPGAELVLLEGMGHDQPPAFWPRIVEAIVALAARVPAK